jgi:hypothetical protein
MLGRNHAHLGQFGVPDFSRLRAALLSVGGGEVAMDSRRGHAQQVLSPAKRLAHEVCRGFDEAVRLSLMMGHSHEELQPLLNMKRTAEMHEEVISRFAYYYMVMAEVRWALLPAQFRPPYGSVEWSDYEYSDSDSDSDSD